MVTKNSVFWRSPWPSLLMTFSIVSTHKPPPALVFASPSLYLCTDPWNWCALGCCLLSLCVVLGSVRSPSGPVISLTFALDCAGVMLRTLSWGWLVAVVQLLGCIQLFAMPWTAARQASLSITNSPSLPKLMSIKLVMSSNHLILCHPLLLPSIFPSIRVFSNESVLCIRWPKYWSFNFRIILPMNNRD